MTSKVKKSKDVVLGTIHAINYKDAVKQANKWKSTYKVTKVKYNKKLPNTTAHISAYNREYHVIGRER